MVCYVNTGKKLFYDRMVLVHDTHQRTQFSKDEIEENAEQVEEETRVSRANDTEQVFLGLPPLGRIPMPQLYLLSSDVSLINPSPTGLKAAGRTLGTYRGQPIIVEWKHYSTKFLLRCCQISSAVLTCLHSSSSGLPRQLVSVFYVA